jgi:hypothetical protein
MEETRDSWIAGILHVPTWLHLRSNIPLDLIELSSLVVHDSILLVNNIGGICLVCQIWFQWDGVFDNNINRRL